MNIAVLSQGLLSRIVVRVRISFVQYMVLSKQKEGAVQRPAEFKVLSALTFMIFFGLTKYYKVQKDYM